MNARWFSHVTVLLALMALGAGCKGGGGGPEVAFLEVLETSPPDDSDSVQVETRIGFRVNAPIDPDTLTSENFFVTDSDGAQIQGTLAIDDEPAVAVLTPNEPLRVLTTFTATITTGLSSAGGATLEEDYDWQFTTLDSAWGDSEFLEEIGTGISSRPQIAVDAQSNAIAAWKYEEVDGTGIWANRYTRVDLWGEPEQIDDGTGGAANPRLAADDAGNGFAVWERTTPGTSIVNIWVNRYTVDQGWGTPALLQNGQVTQARGPAVAANADGNAIAVWVQRDMSSVNQVVWAIRYEPGTGWGAAGPIDDMPTPTAGEVTAVGMDDEGNAIAVWARPSVPTGGGRSEVLWSNRYTAGSGWGASELIKPDSETRAIGQRLSVGANGDAFVVWEQDDPLRGGLRDVWAVRFSGSTWGAPERIDGYDADDKQVPDIAVDGSGIAHAVWSQTDPDFQNIWANQYMPGSGWGVPELIEPPNPDPTEDADAAEPRIAVNAAGNAFVVWRQLWESWSSVWSNRFDPGSGWLEAELIENMQRAAKSPKIAVDDRRHAQAIWPQARDTGIDWVATNRFE